MKDEDKTKGQLIDELVKLRQWITKLGASVIKHMKAEEERRKAQERFEGIFRCSMDAIAYATLEGIFVDANDAFVNLTGYSREELINRKKYQEITPREYHEFEARMVEELLRTGEPREYEKEYIRKDGSRVPILVTAFTVKGAHGKPSGLAAIIKDISERNEMQERLLRSEKLAVLGQLAGGVGHELRNPLTAIKNAAYFLKMAVEKPEPEVKETLEILEKEVATSERIISSLLGFARPKPPTQRKVDINAIAQEALSRTTVPENVEVTSQLDESLPTILADPDQLGQVFANLILNAIEAMPEGGKLAVKSELLSPEWMAVSFTDTGMGIREENLDKLFEPLFTTKARGIGLGLAITKILIEGHGGTIEVQSEVGKGSTLTVKLPGGEKVEK